MEQVLCKLRHKEPVPTTSGPAAVEAKQSCHFEFHLFGCLKRPHDFFLLKKREPEHTTCLPQRCSSSAVASAARAWLWQAGYKLRLELVRANGFDRMAFFRKHAMRGYPQSANRERGGVPTRGLIPTEFSYGCSKQVLRAAGRVQAAL